jgi:hypothetical protein
MAVILLQKERKGKRKDNSISISVFRREKRECMLPSGKQTACSSFSKLPGANAIPTSPAQTQSPILALSGPTRVIATY